MLFYKTPVLSNHNILYKGKRYWIFEVSKDHPFEGYESISSFVLFDRRLNVVLAWGELDDEDGYIGGVPYGPHVLDVRGKTAKEFVLDVVKQVSWTVKH